MSWLNDLFRRPGVDHGTADLHLAESAGEPGAEPRAWEGIGRWPVDEEPPRAARSRGPGATAYLPVEHGHSYQV